MSDKLLSKADMELAITPRWLFIPSNFDPNSEQSAFSSVSSLAISAMLLTSMLSADSTLFKHRVLVLHAFEKMSHSLTERGLDVIAHKLKDQVYKS